MQSLNRNEGDEGWLHVNEKLEVRIDSWGDSLLLLPFVMLVSTETAHAEAESITELREQANRGDAGAQYRLGSMYAKGEGVPEHDAGAVRRFHRAAGRGTRMPNTFLAPCTEEEKAWRGTTLRLTHGTT